MTLIGAGDGSLSIDLTDHRPAREGEQVVSLNINPTKPKEETKTPSDILADTLENYQKHSDKLLDEPEEF